jgi:hypothetical protein
LFLTVEPDYKLPPPATYRFYEQGKRHTLSNGKDAWAGPYPWTQGDIYLSRLSDFVISKIEDQHDDEEVEKAVAAARFEAMSPAYKRRQSYPSHVQMIEGLWKHIVLGQSLEESGCLDIQTERNRIDDLYPLD